MTTNFLLSKSMLEVRNATASVSQFSEVELLINPSKGFNRLSWSLFWLILQIASTVLKIRFF